MLQAGLECGPPLPESAAMTAAISWPGRTSSSVGPRDPSSSALRAGGEARGLVVVAGFRPQAVDLLASAGWRCTRCRGTGGWIKALPFFPEWVGATAELAVPCCFGDALLDDDVAGRRRTCLSDDLHSRGVCVGAGRSLDSLSPGRCFRGSARKADAVGAHVDEGARW